MGQVQTEGRQSGRTEQQGPWGRKGPELENCKEGRAGLGRGHEGLWALRTQWEVPKGFKQGSGQATRTAAEAIPLLQENG